MLRVLTRIVRRFLIVTGALACLVLAAFGLVWIRRPSPTSAEGVLASADRLARNNNWFGASPLYARAEEMFLEKGDRGGALYAYVSQFPVKMESSDLSTLIAELNQDLALPEERRDQVFGCGFLR